MTNGAGLTQKGGMEIEIGLMSFYKLWDSALIPQP
ncbi:hypothetical protein B1R32_11313 [Abditibacterium utsteinense]|uniref:Uncharacterized protein n=1 Tax=Abditibacterium utsteinense TaxID=1960156 RepID=A0A2S8SR83_9BACT|nr:hypothetical protein B1R32_11313 [Abditibacterium utsteinense]